LDPEAETAQFEAEFHRTVKRVMVQMMLADGEVDEGEVQTIREIYGELTNSELSDADVRSEISLVEREQQDVATSMAQFAGYLNDSGKEIVIRAAFLVAAADGEFHDDEKALLAEIGQALGMSDAHMKGVISSVIQE
jgi:tellurite resistance protein